MLKMKWLSLLLTASCVSLAGAQDNGVRLPDIGSSAATALSPDEMKAYGASMLHEMRLYNYVLDDPLVNDYLNGLGYRLVSVSDRPDLEFTFFVVRDNGINAFAAPGGYIGVNVGLIIAMNTEDELAAVIAHEIAHVTQQHLLRAFEDSRKSTLPIALAMLGALVATAGRTDDAGQAALMSGISLIQQRAINFTRYDEIEADRVGIQSLARAGYDPLAMADTFATMQRVMRVNGIDVPEFLRTHPVDVNRIADAKARAVNLDRSYQPVSTRAPVARRLPQAEGDSGISLDLSIPTPRLGGATAAAEPAAPTDSSYFELMRERSRILNADSANAMLRYYTDELKRGPESGTTAIRYGHALSLTLARQPKAAVEEFAVLTKEFPGSSVFELGMAEAEDQAGMKDAAFKRYERLSKDFPGNRAIALAYTEALLARSDEKSAQVALDLIRPLLTRYPEDPDLQRSFARANELAGDTVRAAEAYAEWAFLNGRAEDALNQLKTLSSKQDLTYYQRARVDARITAMTPIVLDIRKRERRESEPESTDGFSAAARCPDQNCARMSLSRNKSRLQ
ncbi:M48 family metalloprotease [Dokdonella sp.]|uniref:beta-barrel assembly-enhancing protease n=1 Tax=Dokdonella sp. TaxID=2291710 RepID=UPI003529643C